METTTELAPMTVEQLAEQTLQQISIPSVINGAVTGQDIREQHQQAIRELKLQYAPIHINGPEDKESFDLTNKAITAVTKIATDIDKTRAAVTAPWDKAKKTVDAYAKSLELQVRTEVLAPLAAEKQRILTEKDRIEREAREAIERARAERKEAMTMLGFGLFGIEYRHTLPGVDPINELWVLDKSDDEFEGILEKAALQLAGAKELAEKTQNALKEQQRKDKEDAEANAKLAAELKEKEDAINAKITTARKDALVARGMVEECQNGGPVLRMGRMSINVSDLKDCSTGGFDNLCRDVEDEKRIVDARLAKEKLRTERGEQLQKMGVTFDKGLGTWSTPNAMCYWESVGDWNDEQFASMVEDFRKDLEAVAAKAEAERLAKEQSIRDEAAQAERDRIVTEAKAKAEAEEERIRQEGDKGTINALLEDLQITRDASLKYQADAKSSIAKHGLAKCREHIDHALSVLNGTIKDLK